MDLKRVNSLVKFSVVVTVEVASDRAALEKV